MNRKTLLIIFFVSIVVISSLIALANISSQPGKLDEFAKCLKEKKAIFYGAFWCPHCQKQKALFGSSDQYLPYIECSTADGKGQVQICKDKKITNYPTWEFSDKTQMTGEVSLEKLAEKTSCKLP